MDISEFLLDEAALKSLQEPREMMHRLMAGETFQQVMGFSNDTMFEFYDAACRIFAKKKYEDAINAFVFLTTMNPSVSEFWIGLGMAQYHADLKSDALIAFKWSIVTRPTNFDTYLHAVKCSLDLGKVDEALVIAEQAIEVAEDEEQEEMKREAYDLKGFVQSRREKDLTH